MNSIFLFASDTYLWLLEGAETQEKLSNAFFAEKREATPPALIWIGAKTKQKTV